MSFDQHDRLLVITGGQGYTYDGLRGEWGRNGGYETCGGQDNWGQVELEVWRPLAPGEAPTLPPVRPPPTPPSVTPEPLVLNRGTGPAIANAVAGVTPSLALVRARPSPRSASGRRQSPTPAAQPHHRARLASPSSCSPGCAAVLLPMQAACGDFEALMPNVQASMTARLLPCAQRRLRRADTDL